MKSTLMLIEAELQQILTALEELDRKIGGDRKRAIIFGDGRSDVIARVNALEALRTIYAAPNRTNIIGPLHAGGCLRTRLVADRAAALRAHGVLDVKTVASPDSPQRIAWNEELRKLGGVIFALEAGIAALRPKMNDLDEALISAVRLHDELVDHGLSEDNRCQVEMLARGLLEWHFALAAKSAEAVMGVR